jgi:hypothetical protein
MSESYISTAGVSSVTQDGHFPSCLTYIRRAGTDMGITAWATCSVMQCHVVDLVADVIILVVLPILSNVTLFADVWAYVAIGEGC